MHGLLRREIGCYVERCVAKQRDGWLRRRGCLNREMGGLEDSGGGGGGVERLGTNSKDLGAKQRVG
jgi:hypothetical protein